MIIYLYLFQMKAKFTVDDHSHYLFTPCILTEWVLSLLRYDLTAGKYTYIYTLIGESERFLTGMIYMS